MCARLRLPPVRIGILERSELIVVTYSFALSTGYMPYSVHFANKQDLPGESDFGTLSLLLIEAESGRLLSLRRMRSSAEFYEPFHQMLHRQKLRPFDEREYNTSVVDVDSLWLNNQELVWQDAEIQSQLDGESAN